MNEVTESESIEKKKPDFRQRFFSREHRRLVWVPLLGTVLCLVLSVMPYGRSWWWLSPVCLLGYLAGLFWFLRLAIARFVRKRHAAGFAALACLVVALMAVLPVAAISFGMALGSRDRFGDGLQLPEGIELSEPLKEASDPAAVPDPFQAALKAALKAALNRPGSENAPLTASVPSLEILRRDAPDLLERYLAAHPGWHLHERQGSRFATRRWRVKGQWEQTLHGHYSSFNDSDGPRFQTRTLIGLSGKPWYHGARRMEAGLPTVVEIREGNGLFESAVVIPAGDLLVELFEQSDARERRLTRAALVELEREFAMLAAKPDWETARSLLPEGAVIRGEPSFDLLESFQPDKGGKESAKKLLERNFRIEGWMR